MQGQGHRDGANSSGMKQGGPGETPRFQGRVSMGTGASPQATDGVAEGAEAETTPPPASQGLCCSHTPRKSSSLASASVSVSGSPPGCRRLMLSSPVPLQDRSGSGSEED
ncbi:hypothetical protein D623_10003880 [Myotis brandtii]|uniref:Uncharacterized protein n=1 Tax=Myotis brandtii TaxID=109478 RepID=S7MKM2_MYOBR|nr:hypothetical protein D623_10003880 [Myotis brandtii]